VPDWLNELLFGDYGAPRDVSWVGGVVGGVAGFPVASATGWPILVTLFATGTAGSFGAIGLYKVWERFRP
jgi:hypothetical protein